MMIIILILVVMFILLFLYLLQEKYFDNALEKLPNISSSFKITTSDV